MSLSFLIHAVAFIVAVSLLVTVHEFGHYWVARRLGFKVLRFSVGFGKALWKRVAGPDQTEYVIAAVPMGGYVKMLDERDGPVPEADLHRAFTRRPHWQRILVLLAGPAFNILFAILVLTGIDLVSGITQIRPVLGAIEPSSILGRAGFKSGEEIVSIDSRPVNSQEGVLLGFLDAVSGSAPIIVSARADDGSTHTSSLDLPPGAARLKLTEPEAMAPSLGLRFYEAPMPALLAAVVANGPAAKAGLKAGDLVVAFNGEPIRTFLDLEGQVHSHPAQSVEVRYRRGSSEQTARLTTSSVTDNGKTIGLMGIESVASALPPGMVRHMKLSLGAAFLDANVEAWNMTALQGRLFWRMLVGQVSVKNLSGPLSIAQYAGDSAVLGPTVFLHFLIIVSLALGFMNLLPIPIFDGGQILFQTIEWLKGSPLSERFQIIGQQLGMVLLALLLGVSLYNDIARQLG
jgi:regulator of sigma E protease